MDTDATAEPGAKVIFRETEEHVTIVAVLDASGTLLVEDADGARFQATADEVEATWARHAGCACCG